MKKQKSKYLSITLAIVMTFSTAYESLSALSLINGDFQDTAGLVILGGGWYGGVPNGWTGNNGSYSVMNWNSGDIAANLNVLGPGGDPFRPLYQSAGLLDSAGIVRLSFDILHFVPGPTVGVGIFNTNSSVNYADWTPLALPAAGGYTSAGRITLETTAPIAAGTNIGVAFWQSGGGAAGVDNVNVVPEPSAFSLLVAGSCLTFVLGARRRRQSRSL